MRYALAPLTLLLVWLTPALVHACPVCFSGNDANREAYTLTFLLLTVLPLAMIGGLVLWVRRRIREVER